MKRILVIQTAFIGDAILGTALLERLQGEFPEARIDYLVRNGNQGLFQGHPYLNEVLVWNKRESKYVGLWQMLKVVRNNRYDAVYNIQRYAASGLLTGLSGASLRIGYQNNPFSFLFTQSVRHRLGKGFKSVHEVDRVLDLFETNEIRIEPRLYPTEADFEKVNEYAPQPYITIAAASVWFTKQFPMDKWVDFIEKVPKELIVYLIGGRSDRSLANHIIELANRPVTDLTGELHLLETAALMKNAEMNYANDSAPVHIASAVNAPIAEVYCSTVPEFGFTPLSDHSVIVQTTQKLDCRPCGIHGRSNCPKGHFKCATTISVDELLKTLPVH